MAQQNKKSPKLPNSGEKKEYICISNKTFLGWVLHLILDKLYKLGVRGKLFSFLISYFHDRRQCVKVGNSYSDFVTTRNGGPQGSTIVLFVFLLYINDICDVIHEREFALFMDDVALMIFDPNS